MRLDKYLSKQPNAPGARRKTLLAKGKVLNRAVCKGDVQVKEGDAVAVEGRRCATRDSST